MTTGIRVIEQAHHRNGVGGAPFIVSLVEWRGTGAPSPLFVAVSFPDGHDRGAFIGQTAVLNTQLAAEGSIAFAEGNSWRGSDDLGPAIADAWRERCMEGGEYGGGYDPFAPDEDEPDEEPASPQSMDGLGMGVIARSLGVP